MEKLRKLIKDLELLKEDPAKLRGNGATYAIAFDLLEDVLTAITDEMHERKERLATTDYSNRSIDFQDAVEGRELELERWIEILGQARSELLQQQ